MGFFESLFGEAVKGVLGSVNSNVNNSQINIENAYKRLKPIYEVNYPDFLTNPKGFLSKPGCLWFMRKDLEAARFYCSGGKEGYQVSDRVQANSLGSNEALKALKECLDTTEEKLKEMEQAKGYCFFEVKDNNILFKDIKTGSVLSADDSGRI